MIIGLTNILNVFTQKNYDYFIKHIDFTKVKCPKCHKKGHFGIFGHYTRGVKNANSKYYGIDYITVTRVQCKSCSSTHAVLPSCLVPFSQLTMKDAISIVLAISKKQIENIMINNPEISFQNIRTIKDIYNTIWKERIEKYELRIINHFSFIDSCLSLFKQQFLTRYRKDIKYGSCSCHITSKDSPP